MASDDKSSGWVGRVWDGAAVDVDDADDGVAAAIVTAAAIGIAAAPIIAATIGIAPAIVAASIGAAATIGVAAAVVIVIAASIGVATTIVVGATIGIGIAASIIVGATIGIGIAASIVVGATIGIGIAATIVVATTIGIAATITRVGTAGACCWGTTTCIWSFPSRLWNNRCIGRVLACWGRYRSVVAAITWFLNPRSRVDGNRKVSVCCRRHDPVGASMIELGAYVGVVDCEDTALLSRSLEVRQAGENLWSGGCFGGRFRSPACDSIFGDLHLAVAHGLGRVARVIV